MRSRGRSGPIAAKDRGGDQRVGRYAIQGEIATGGMATVHHGRLLGPAGFTRGVAIKRLHPQYARDPDFVAMFLDEARLASRILHPNVVPILDVVAESGELFLVMEFVPGESLGKLFRRTPEGVPLNIALSIAVGMLEGLHAAHEARGEDGKPLRIVHRDVSPQNVLLGLDGVARLIDFGVAKASGNSTATRDGQIKGKVAYMSPEQIRAEPVDRRADLYAMSVVLWEMLTGKRLFAEADSDLARMHLALNGEIPPPSRTRPELARELDEIVLRGLSRDPAQRFASARDMAQALERVAQPAAARDVARWVEAKAGEVVRLRAQSFGEFDLSVATELPGQASPLAFEDRSQVTSPTLAAGAEISGSFRRDTGSANTTRMGLFIGLALAAAGGIGFYASRLVSPNSTPTSVAGARGPSIDAKAAATADVPLRAATVAAPGTAPTASAAPEPTASASAAASPVKRAVSTPVPARPSATAVKTARPGCTPPFIVTPDGMKQYKPECLK